MSQTKTEPPSKIVMLAPAAAVLIIYGYLFHSPQQTDLQSARRRFDALASAEQQTLRELRDTMVAASEVKQELRDIESQLDALRSEEAALMAGRDRLWKQLTRPSRPAGTMQRVTHLMEAHRLHVPESQPGSGSADRAAEVLKPVFDLVAESQSAGNRAGTERIDGREVYQLTLRGRFNDLRSALASLAAELDHVLPLSLQLEPLNLESAEARQAERIWKLTILV
jgi:hypothetical protein